MCAHQRDHRSLPLRRVGLALFACAGLAASLPCEAGDDGRRNAADCHSGTAGWDAQCLRQQYGVKPASWPSPVVDPGVAWQEMALVPAPPSTAPEILQLGQKLFFDQRLSRKEQLACASCHQPDKAFGDGRQLAVGEDRLQGRRRSQPLIGAPFAPRLFWDGRAESLEQQVLMPIADSREMNHALPDLLARLAGLQDYRPVVAAAFGQRAAEKGLSQAQLSQALASFVRTIRPELTAFDRFLSGDAKAMSDTELVGLHLFRTKARCMNCHSGPLLSDFGFHDLGLSLYGRRNQDLGRFEFTRDKADLGTFRTPSLRNVSRAGPWMHNGSFVNLQALVRTYNAGMGNVSGEADDPFVPKKSPLIQRLDLSDKELAALAAFLQAL